MARNPAWTADELLLALDLYLRMPDARSASHPAVQELSAVLNALPIHTVRPDQEKFRNANGVALKLANWLALDPNYAGIGMTRGGGREPEIWARYHGRSAEVLRIAEHLRAGLSGGGFPVAPEEGEDEAEEGRLLFRQHRVRERDRRLAAQKKASARTLACEACGFDFERTYGTLGRGFIECHHLTPLAQTGPTRTRLSDLALLCPNCHRMAHRRRPWASLADLQQLLKDNEPGPHPVRTSPQNEARTR